MVPSRMRAMEIVPFVILFKIFELCCFPTKTIPLLDSLDKGLCKMFERPEKASGGEILDTMTLYNWSLSSLRDCVERKETTVAKAARDLRTQGGPLFLKRKMTDDSMALLKIDLRWSEQDMQKMLELRSDVDKNWKAFYKAYRKRKELFDNYLNDTCKRICGKKLS